MLKEDLKIGNRYFYWSKSHWEKKASKKFCTLRSYHGHFARVEREDLEVHNLQDVLIDRLQAISEVKIVKSERKLF